MRRLGLLVLAVTAVGCFNFDGAVDGYCASHGGFCDGGVAGDAGAVDAGAMDAGAMDAGTVDAGTVDAGTRDAGSACPTRRSAPPVGAGCHAYDFASGIPTEFVASNPSDNYHTSATVTLECGMLRVRYGANTGAHDLWCTSAGDVLDTAYRLEQPSSTSATSIALWFQAALTQDEQGVGVFSRLGQQYAVGALAYTANSLSTYSKYYTVNNFTCTVVPEQAASAFLGDAGSVLSLVRTSSTWTLNFQGNNTTTMLFGAAPDAGHTLGVFVGAANSAVDVFIEYIVLCH